MDSPKSDVTLHYLRDPSTCGPVRCVPLRDPPTNQYGISTKLSANYLFYLDLYEERKSTVFKIYEAVEKQ